MAEYQSIKEDVLKKLSEHMPEIRERFGIETLGIFGSVARGEDTEESDVDILYTFREGRRGGVREYYAVIEYLENLIGREIDFIPLNYLQPHFRVSVESSSIFISSEASA